MYMNSCKKIYNFIIIVIIIITPCSLLLIAPFALSMNHSFILSFVNSTLIASPGDTTQSLTSLPSHFNP